MITNEIINGFVKCAYKAYLLFHNEHGTKSAYELLEDELVNRYKAQFDVDLQARYDEEHILLPLNFGKGFTIAEASCMLHPVFQTKEVNIAFDAIELIPYKDASNTCSYLPIVLSPREKVSKTEKLLLSVKCLLVARQQKLSIESGKIVYGRNLKTTKIHLATYEKQAKNVMKDLMKAINNQDAPRFFQTAHCKICEFQKRCQATLREKDDLSLLSGMNPTEVLKKNNRGIFTILQFSYTFRPRRKNKKSSNTHLRFEPALKALALREKRAYIQKIPKLPENDIEVYMDFEGLPDENFVYLIGLIIKHGESETRCSFWADSEQDEERIFQRLFKTVSRFKNFTVYHYGSYESQSLKRFNKKSNNAYEKELDMFLGHSINILTFFSSTIYPPTYTNGLKDIAGFLEFSWSGKNASGIQSIVWRKHWELYDDVKYKNMLVQYNLEDCQALQVTQNWLTCIGGEHRLQKDDQDPVNVDDIKIQSAYKFGDNDFLVPEFNDINKFAYFNYQRDKIYVKTNTQLKKFVKRKQKQLKNVNRPDKIVEAPVLEKCPYCNSTRLTRLRQTKKTIIDLKFTNNGIKKWIVQFSGTGFRCRVCNKRSTPLYIKNIPRRGRNLIIWSINQHLAHKMYLEKVGDMLLESFHIKLSKGGMYHFKAILSKEYQTTLAEIKQGLITGALIHTDETKVNILGVTKYVWVFTNIDTVYYLFRPTREADFLHDWLQGFEGVLVSDFYTGYDSLPCAQQRCLIHFIRDLNDDLFKNQFDVEFKEIVTRFGKLLKLIIDTVNQYGLKTRHLSKHWKDVERFYRQIIMKEYDSELAISYQKKFKKYKVKLFTFLDYDGIPWNNNNAETAIKFFATYRRELRGSATDHSIGDSLLLLSIQQTCSYRGISFLEFLKSGEKSIEVYSRIV